MVERSIAWLVAKSNRRVRYRGVERNQHGLATRVAAINLRRLVNLGLDHRNGTWILAGQRARGGNKGPLNGFNPTRVADSHPFRPAVRFGHPRTHNQRYDLGLPKIAVVQQRPSPPLRAIRPSPDRTRAGRGRVP